MVTAGYRIVALWRSVLFFGCCVRPSAVVAFTAPTTARWITSRSLGLSLDLDPTFVETTSIVVSAAATAAAKATAASTTTTATGSSTAVFNFLAGSFVLIGIVGTFKWNDAESSEQIRAAWDKVVDSTSTFGTAPPTQPSTARMESTMIAAPETIATPTTTNDAVTPTTKVTTTAVSMPQPKDAASPEELIDMMKNVRDTTKPTKKRFLVRLLKKIVMPWKKWSNL